MKLFFTFAILFAGRAFSAECPQGQTYQCTTEINNRCDEVCVPFEGFVCSEPDSNGNRDCKWERGTRCTSNDLCRGVEVTTCRCQ